MNKEINNKLKKLSSYLLYLSIINLFIISLVPWISIIENDTHNELFFNSLMMERSENNQIKDIGKYIFFIINLLWMGIILNSILYLGFTDYLSEKYPKFTKVIINTGNVNLIINVIIVYLQIFIIKKIIQMDNVSFASFISIIKFAYIPFIFGFVLLIISIIYTSSVIHNILKQKESLKSYKKEMESKNLIGTSKKFVEKQFPSNENFSNFKLDIKNIKSSYWLEQEKKQTNHDNIKSDLEFFKTKKFIKNSFENDFVEKDFLKTKNESNLDPFPVEKPKIKSKSSNEILISQELEKALSSIVKKRQNETKMQPPAENTSELNKEKYKDIETKVEIKENEKKEIKKKINLRCPQCKFIFPIEKNESVITVKCPNCGKEGVIKYLNDITKHQQ